MKRVLLVLYMMFGNSFIYPKQVRVPVEMTKNTAFITNLGNCIEGLRNDIQHFPYSPLNWDLYTKDLEFVDPGGVTTYGLERYKQNLYLLRLFRNIIGLHVDITYRLRYDADYQRIVITWYSVWHTNLKSDYIDAISTFYLNKEGIIYKHVVDRKKMSGNSYTDVSQSILFKQASNHMYAYDDTQNMLIDTCEYMWDCSGGVGLPINPQPIPIPIPIPVSPIPEKAYL